MRCLTEAPVTQPQPRWWSQESPQQGTQLRPEVLDGSSCGGMSRLDAGDVHGGLMLTPPASGHY